MEVLNLRITKLAMGSFWSYSTVVPASDPMVSGMVSKLLSVTAKMCSDLMSPNEGGRRERRL